MQLKLSSDELLKLEQVDAISYILLRQKSLGLPISPAYKSYNYSQMRTIISNWHFLSPQREICHFCPLPYFPFQHVWKESKSQARRPDPAWWGKGGVKCVPPAAAASCLSCHSSAYNSSLTPQAVVVVVVAVVELVVTLAITALTPQAALSAVTHHWSRVVERNQPTCPTYTGGGSRKQTRTGSILSQDDEKRWSQVMGLLDICGNISSLEIQMFLFAMHLIISHWECTRFCLANNKFLDVFFAF